MRFALGDRLGRPARSCGRLVEDAGAPCARARPRAARGVVGGASRHRVAAARREAAARRAARSAWARCPGSPPAVPCACAAVSMRGIERIRPCVYGWRGCGEQLARPVASSTTLPAYITTTRCAVSATTPIACVISMIAMPSRSFSSASRSRICAWIVTSSAVVGSSAISSLRIAGQGDRDHHPLAHAARELVRVVVDAPLRASGCRTSASISTARSSAALRPSPSCRRTASAICSPTV